MSRLETNKRNKKAKKKENEEKENKLNRQVNPSRIKKLGLKAEKISKLLQEERERV